MRGAIPPLPQYAPVAWCSVKAQRQLNLYLLNETMQAAQINTTAQNNKINAFRKASEMWRRTLDRNTLTCFLLLKDVFPAIKQKLTRNLSPTLGCFIETLFTVF